MRASRLLLVSLLLWTSACERDRAQQVPSREPSASVEHRVETRIAEGIAKARARLEQEYPLPERRARERCPDETLPASSSTREAVMVRVRDGRTEKRSPLPLALLTRLESNEFATVLSHISGGAVALWDATQTRAFDAQSGHEALQALEALEKRPYLAEVVVETYGEPKLFRRKEARRSEWAAGHLAGRVVVRDIHRGRALCQSEFAVRGDATGAPISRRLRETTRERLRGALLDRSWDALGAALSSISSRLELPHSSARNDPDQRWAAAVGEERKIAR